MQAISFHEDAAQQCHVSITAENLYQLILPTPIWQWGLCFQSRAVFCCCLWFFSVSWSRNLMWKGNLYTLLNRSCNLCAYYIFWNTESHVISTWVNLSITMLFRNAPGSSQRQDVLYSIRRFRHKHIRRTVCEKGSRKETYCIIQSCHHFLNVVSHRWEFSIVMHGLNTKY